MILFFRLWTRITSGQQEYESTKISRNPIPNIKTWFYSPVLIDIDLLVEVTMELKKQDKSETRTSVENIVSSFEQTWSTSVPTQQE